MIKKLLVLALAAGGSWYAVRRMQAERAEQDLWAEATDPVQPGG
jgi:hypothetical protein